MSEKEHIAALRSMSKEQLASVVWVALLGWEMSVSSLFDGLDASNDWDEENKRRFTEHASTHIEALGGFLSVLFAQHYDDGIGTMDVLTLEGADAVDYFEELCRAAVDKPSEGRDKLSISEEFLDRYIRKFLEVGEIVDQVAVQEDLVHCVKLPAAMDPLQLAFLRRPGPFDCQDEVQPYGLYPLGDIPSDEEVFALAAGKELDLSCSIVAAPTGLYGSPDKGGWYLRGGECGGMKAYKATLPGPNYSRQVLAKLVLVRVTHVGG